MCTNKFAQPQGHFQRLGGLLTNHPDPNPNNDELSSERCTLKKSLQLFRAL